MQATLGSHGITDLGERLPPRCALNEPRGYASRTRAGRRRHDVVTGSRRVPCSISWRRASFSATIFCSRAESVLVAMYREERMLECMGRY